MPATSPFRTSSTCASCARTTRTAGSSSIDMSAAQGAARRLRGLDRRRHSDDPPIDFREGRIEKLEPYRQPVLATDRVRYVGDPVAAVFADDPYIAEDAAELVTIEIEELPVLLARRGGAGRVFARPQHRGGGRAPGLRRRRRGVPRGACGRRAGARRSAAIPACRSRRAAPSAATTPRATCSSCTAPPRCRTATAICSRACSSAARRDQPARVPCRRRLRHPRRALSGGRAGLHRRDAARPAGEMDRGSARASDRAPTIRASRPTRSAPAVDARRPHPRHRRRVLARPGRLCAHARDPRRDDDLRHPARPLSRAGLSLRRSCPAHQQDAGRHLSRARPLRDELRARATDRRDRGEARDRSDRGPPAQRDHRGRDAVHAGRSKCSAKRSSTTPATISRCSTRCSRRPTGTSCKARC